MEVQVADRGSSDFRHARHRPQRKVVDMNSGSTVGLSQELVDIHILGTSGLGQYLVLKS